MDGTASDNGMGSRLEHDIGKRRHSVVISANAFWNIRNFRNGLIDALVRNGLDVTIACPKPDHAWAEKKGIESDSLDIDRSGLSPLGDARLLFEYIRLFKRRCPQFYLGFTVKPNIYGTMAARMMGVTALPNVSGLGTAFISNGLLSRLVGFLYGLAFRGCPIVFFQNPDDEALFIRRGIVGPDQVRLLPGSGIDLDRFSPACQEPAVVTFLFVGRILGDKGVREFVEAARLLREEQPTWLFQLLGPVDEDNRTAIDHDELNIWINEGVVEYLGTTDDVRPFIAASTAVVLPSYREGLPRTLLEAAAMVRPLIATDVPGNRQIVHHGVNGLLCAPRDSNALADAMLTLGRKSSAERQAMGSAGRQLVEDSFGEERVISAYLDAMAQLRASSGV